MLSSEEIRSRFLKFFEKRGHKIIPSASLVPENDPSVLFTTAGMHPLVPYFLGEKHPGGKRVANFQKCVRTVDIEEVGDASHLTFFEMLGNWSFGDYFKKEAIDWSWEFLTGKEWLGLDKNKIAVSVFAGDENAPFDEDSFKIWKSLGMPEKKIAKLPKEDNWWGPAGQIGPCGPDTEIFYWIGDNQPPDAFQKTHNDRRWMEIWNNVFMEYNKTQSGKYEQLKQKNVDTGMGLERMAMVMQGKNSVYETDMFAPIVAKIKNQILKVGEKKSIRIIADHIKASIFIIADGVEPSNIGRGYVLRRLIRRAVRHGKIIGIKEDITEPVFEIYKDFYPELGKNKEHILSEIIKEEKKFDKTLETGLKEFEKIIKLGKISGHDAFILFSTYGFPLEMTKELALEKGITVDAGDFEKELKKHQEFSKTASAGVFKGGLADSGEQTKKLHAATHLLHQALKIVLGNHVMQKGSNITSERLRFDFSHNARMSDEEKKEVENIVNQKINEALPISFQEIKIGEAKNAGALGVFGDKYGEIVRVYKIGDEEKGIFSMELCGGPHVENTSRLGHFKIVKEEAVSAGVRRIKAILD